MIGRPPPCRRSAVALQDGRRAVLTAPTLDGADVALQAREKHLHRGLTPLVFRPSTGGVKPSDAPRSIAQQSASVGVGTSGAPASWAKRSPRNISLSLSIRVPETPSLPDTRSGGGS